jgi:hypothetical protein
MRGFQNVYTLLLTLAVERNFTVMAAEFTQLEAVGGVLRILIGRIVAVVAFGALQRKIGTISLRHDDFLIISLTYGLIPDGADDRN